MEQKSPNDHISHIVAMPYPARGHINPMMNFCKLISSRKSNLLITFVVTEEWLSFIQSEPKPDTIKFATIPNVIPSELVRAKEFENFFEAVMTKMEAPVDSLLDQLQLPVTVIVYDAMLSWAIDVGNRRNISVTALWPASAKVFPVSDSWRARLNNRSETELRILRTIFQSLLRVSNTQSVIVNSVYELETGAFDTLKLNYNIPIYPIPCIPYFNPSEDGLELKSSDRPSYLHWLDSQPKGSVLYISQGSFLSLSEDQMNEISAGVRASSVKYIWVARGDTRSLKEICGDNGIIVPWCDQMRVLSHPSVGGFWTHCGWNSTLESVFAGVPMLTFPLGWDQNSNREMIVEKWGVGWKVKKGGEENGLVGREEICEVVKRFMDAENSERNDMIRRMEELRRQAVGSVEEGGSVDENLNAFIRSGM